MISRREGCFCAGEGGVGERCAFLLGCGNGREEDTNTYYNPIPGPWNKQSGVSSWPLYYNCITTAVVMVTVAIVVGVLVAAHFVA